jgi:hypothetical protein
MIESFPNTGTCIVEATCSEGVPTAEGFTGGGDAAATGICHPRAFSLPK